MDQETFQSPTVNEGRSRNFCPYASNKSGNGINPDESVLIYDGKGRQLLKCIDNWVWALSSKSGLNISITLYKMVLTISRVSLEFDFSSLNMMSNGQNFTSLILPAARSQVPF